MSKVVDLTEVRFQRQLAHADDVFEHDVIAGLRLRDLAHVDRFRADPRTYSPAAVPDHDDDGDDPR